MQALRSTLAIHAADLCAVPEPRVAQIVAGELVNHPRPAVRHARAISSLGIELGGPFDRGRGGPRWRS
ncbi:MAG: hypothetical protein ACPGUV_04890 [Polyangiales bacterium]